MPDPIILGEGCAAAARSWSPTRLEKSPHHDILAPVLPGTGQPGLAVKLHMSHRLDMDTTFLNKY